MTLMDSPPRHRRHNSAFVASDIPGRPTLATNHLPFTCTVALTR
jgi:hypothetical protein